MNWIGGRLQRHSRNAGNGVINRQKQHFANIRSQLQNGAAPQAIPFTPSFLQENVVSLGARQPRFRDRSPGHPGYSRRSQQLVHYDKTLNSQGEQVDEMSVFPKLTDSYRHDYNAITRPSPAACQRTYRQEYNQRKRKFEEFSSEDNCLEANKRKLLERPDWASIAPSRPVHVHFQSCKEKQSVGKRRKINSCALLRDGDMMTRQLLRDTKINVRGPFMSGAIVTDLEDISIRIGTDALATQLPSERSEPLGAAVSTQPESPDPMLFDFLNEEYTSRRARSGSAKTIDTFIIGSHARNKTVSQVWKSAPASPPGSGRLHQAQQYERKFIFSDRGDIRLGQNLEKNKHDDLGIDGRARGAPVAAVLDKQEQEDHLDALPESIHAQKQPGASSPNQFHFVLQSSPFSLPAVSPQGVSQGHYAAVDLSPNVAATCLGGGDNQKRDVASSIVHERSPCETRIVDDTPWKTFLAIRGVGSSHSTTTNISEESFLHRQQSIGNTLRHQDSYHDAIDSTRGTAGRRTAVETLSSSESTRPFQSDESHQVPLETPGKRTALNPKPAGVSRDTADRVDELWKKFVFGGGDDEGGSPASDIVHDAAVLDSVQMPSANGVDNMSHKLLRSCSVATRSTSTISLTKPGDSAHPSLRNDVHVRTAWDRRGNDEEDSSGGLASGSLYNNVARLISPPVAAAYSDSPGNY